MNKKGKVRKVDLKTWPFINSAWPILFSPENFLFRLKTFQIRSSKKTPRCNKTKSHQLCDDLLLVGTPDNSSRFFNRFAPDKFLPLLRQCSPPLSGASRLTLYAVSRLTISDNFLRFLRSFALENSLHFFRRFAPENITQSRLTRRSAPEAAMARFGPTFRTLHSGASMLSRR